MLSWVERVMVLLGGLLVGAGTFYVLYSVAIVLNVNDYNIPGVCGAIMTIVAARVFKDDLEDRKRTLK